MADQSKTFNVPQNVRDAAKRGLELRREHGRGGLDTRQAKKEGVGSGVQRASNLIQGKVSYATVKRMLAFFNRHKAFKEHHSDKTSAAWISWQIWGGDAGFAWAKRIVAQEEKAEKGGFLSLLLFGGEGDSEVEAQDEQETATAGDEAPQAKALSFTELLAKARKPVPDMELVPLGPDEEFEYNGPVIEEAPPPDAIKPTEAPLSLEQLQAIAAAQSDEEAEAALKKGVVEIDLNEDYVASDKSEESTAPAPASPPEPLDEPPLEPQLQEHDFSSDGIYDSDGLEVRISAEDYRRLKKHVKQFRLIPNAEPAAQAINKAIMKGKVERINLSLLQSYLTERDLNAQVVGGDVMLSILAKAEPKVPEKYLEGLKGAEREKRKKQIQARMKEQHRGEKYKELPGDKDAESKPSKYSKTAFAQKVRDKMKSSSKEAFLGAAAEVSGIAQSILTEVYKRGSEAWATSGHRPGASQEAWARARVYSFATNGKTRHTADKDLWEKHKKG